MICWSPRNGCGLTSQEILNASFVSEEISNDGLASEGVLWSFVCQNVLNHCYDYSWVKKNGISTLFQYQDFDQRSSENEMRNKVAPGRESLVG